MTEQAAQMIFAVIMTVGFLFWLWSLQKALALGGRTAAAPDWRLISDQPATVGDIESGTRTVRGAPEELSQALARSLTQLAPGGFMQMFEITERTANRIAIKKTGPLVCNQPAGIYFSDAEIRLEPVGYDTTRVTYFLGFDRLIRLLRKISLSIIVGIGLPVMLIVGSLVWFVVIPSDAPGVRWQVFQAVQIVHALWPPFMFLGMYNTGRRQSKTYFSNLLSTLELAEQPNVSR